jgi:hypothetical protein
MAADHQQSLNDCFSRLLMLPSLLAMGSFSPVPVIRNVAVVELPEGIKNRSNSAPERSQVAFSAVGHDFPHPMGCRRAPSAKQKVQLPVTTGSVNRSSDFGRRKMYQPVVLDQQNGKQ